MIYFYVLVATIYSDCDTERVYGQCYVFAEDLFRSD